MQALFLLSPSSAPLHPSTLQLLNNSSSVQHPIREHLVHEFLSGVFHHPFELLQRYPLPMELLAVLLVYTIFAAAVPWMHFPGTPHTAGHKRLSVDSDSSSTAAPRSYYVSVVETKTKTTTVTALASLPSRPYSVTKNVTTADKPKTKTMW